MEQHATCLVGILGVLACTLSVLWVLLQRLDEQGKQLDKLRVEALLHAGIVLNDPPKSLLHSESRDEDGTLRSSDGTVLEEPS